RTLRSTPFPYTTLFRSPHVPPVAIESLQLLILPDGVTVTASQPPALCMNHSNPTAADVHTVGFEWFMQSAGGWEAVTVTPSGRIDGKSKRLNSSHLVIS